MEALPRSEPHSAAMLAVGSRCGRIALFDASSMQQQEIIALPSDTASMLSMPAEQSSNPAEVAHRGEQLLNLYPLFLIDVIIYYYCYFYSPLLQWS